MIIAKIALGIFASTSLASLLCAQTKITHPLDGLASNEYWIVHDVLHSSGHWTDKTLVASLLLHEPAKQVVLTWKPGQPVPREADVILESEGKTIEARIDIANQKLEFWNEVPEVQAPVTQTELDTMNDVVKKDPRVIAALKARRITNLATVRCDMIPLTFTILPEQNSHRIGYGTCADGHAAFHSWGRAVEGLYIVADMTAEKILNVIDHGPLPVPRGEINFEEAAAVPREGTTPIQVVQPLGPSYKIVDGEVQWQNWHFRFRLDPRVGPVVNLVRYQDGNRLRSILYEGSLSEMYVPYMDPDLGWNSRAFLDAGEFLLGGLIKPVAPEDCPSHAQYFPGIVPSDRGTPVLVSRLACLFEHTTDSPAWRHFEDGVLSVRPSRELVLRTSAVAGNYDYLLDWIFQQDGTIRVAVGATGIVETKAVKETIAHAMHDASSTLEHGTLVDKNLLAVNHDHYFSYRLDLDVDGTDNSFMIHRLVTETLSGQARKSIWAAQSSLAKTEKDAILDIDLRHPGMWHFINPSQHGAMGYPPGYEIMPGPTAVSFVSPDDPAQRRGAFSAHQMWVTPYDPDELYAAGVYVTRNKESDGLSEWTKADRSIENKDIVGWYTLGFHHVVRLEDWPVMPVLWHDFLIRPANFFEKNPALTLPHEP